MDLLAVQFYSVPEGTGVVPPERICPTPGAKSKSAATPQSLSKPPRGPSVAANLPCNESYASPLFPKSKISTEGPFALKKRLLHFLFAATLPHVSLAGGPKRGFELP